MSYRLELYEPIPDGVKRIVTEQVDQALDSLTDLDHDIDESIHDARKRFKKIRAVMRLVRDEIGDEVYQRENLFYRDAGRQLADLRDSAVAVQTLDRITEHFADELAEDAFQVVREKLVRRQQEVRQQILTNDTIDNVRSLLSLAKRRIGDLPVKHDDFSAFDDGLKRVYKRGSKGLKRAYEQAHPEDFHEWRKRVKYLWYHMRILKPVWPDMQDELADSVHDLADYLGDAHDLTEFHHLINEHPDLTESKDTAQALIGLANRWRRELETTAQPLGQRIYAEKPKAFIRRMAAYWDATQLEKQSTEGYAQGMPVHAH